MLKSKQLHSYRSHRLERLRTQGTKADLQEIPSFTLVQHEDCSAEQFQSTQSCSDSYDFADEDALYSEREEFDELEEKEGNTDTEINFQLFRSVR